MAFQIPEYSLSSADVLAGNVGIFNNYNLCHVKTINWDEIISGINSKVNFIKMMIQIQIHL